MFVLSVSQQKQTELDLSTEVATRLSLVDRETVSLPDSHSAHLRHSDEDVPRLTKVGLKGSVGVLLFEQRMFVSLQLLIICVQEMAVEVSGALAQSDPNIVLSAAFKLRITQRDLATLQEGGWLNDEVRQEKNFGKVMPI